MSRPAPRARLVIGGIALVLLLACGGFAALFRFDSGPGEGSAAADLDPEQVERVAAEGELIAAAERLIARPAARYTGWYPGDGGERVELDARITNEGSTVARITVGKTTAEVIDLGEKTFAKGGAAFWKWYGIAAEDAAAYARQWVHVPGDAFGMDFSEELAPWQLAAQLAPGVADQGSADPDVPVLRGAPTTLDGAEVVPVQREGLTFYVTAAGPKRLVRVTTETTAATGFRTAAYRIDEEDLRLIVSELSDEERGVLKKELEKRITQLKKAIDSEVRFSLDGDIVLNPCTTNGCTATLTVANRVTAGRIEYARAKPVTANVTITMTLDGKPAKTCPETKTMKPNGSAKVVCRASYYIPPSRNPKTHQVQARAVATAQAVVAADVTRMLKDITDELARFGKPREGLEYYPKGPASPPLNARQQAAKERIQQLATKACNEVKQLPGESAKAWGTRVHTRFRELIRQEPGSSRLFGETPYLKGKNPRKWRNPKAGTSGWPKDTRVPDALLGDSQLQPELFMDLKTGAEGIDATWAKELWQQLPDGYDEVPILTIRC